MIRFFVFSLLVSAYLDAAFSMPIVVSEDSKMKSYRYSINLDPELFGFYGEQLMSGQPIGIYQSSMPEFSNLTDQDGKTIDEKNIESIKNTLSRHTKTIANISGGVISTKVDEENMARMNRQEGRDQLQETVNSYFSSRLWITQDYLDPDVGKTDRKPLWDSNFSDCLSESAQLLSIATVYYESFKAFGQERDWTSSFSLPSTSEDQANVLAGIVQEYTRLAGSGDQFPCITFSEDEQLRKVLSGRFQFNKYNQNPEKLVVLKRLSVLSPIDRVSYAIFVRLAFGDEFERAKILRFLWLKSQTTNLEDQTWQELVEIWKNDFLNTMPLSEEERRDQKAILEDSIVRLNTILGD